MFISKRESAGLKPCNDSKAFMEHSNEVNDIYRKLDDSNPNRKRKILIIFDVFADMIADILRNKKVQPIVTELFIRGSKLSISLVFVTQCYFAVLKNIIQNSIHYFIYYTKF